MNSGLLSADDNNLITPPAAARIFGYVATEADVCVLLRRGPSKWVLMVRWDLATDEFEIGQWLHARVYEDRCDISPDGRLFAYQALDGKWQSVTNGLFTAISRPPYDGERELIDLSHYEFRPLETPEWARQWP